ncbi:nucleotide sugar dehydrogenase [Roseibium aestuarii]|uniref:Nucleotide sugar dehydrogenase n=1 Tax=Roseibium aestuarii TaxID=2600299 RepID=A0ABW4JS70_9HYPH|nr:nucleotide sugar dehydrogenase [Roseibium aestuarii]
MSDPAATLPRLAVVGLGYVGLPVAVAFAEAGHEVLGFDINASRIAELRQGRDSTGSVVEARLSVPTLRVSETATDMASANVIIVAVPTPVDQAKRPDMSALKAAARTVGGILRAGMTVVFESTVYPGVTEDVILPILREASGLSYPADFSLGYSPERINPGDPDRDFKDIVKVVAGNTPAVTEALAALYGRVVTAGIHKAPNIKTAEAAKVIENTQRDLNIALMNELAQVFHAMGLDTRDVLAGAATKWNFLPFQPGLVGGHCIGVDPYYLTHKAHELNLTPQVILAGRGTNEHMPAFVATKVIQTCVKLGRPLPLKIAVLGLTYKANVPDTRNSKVVDLIRELKEFGAQVKVHDPLADPAHVDAEYGLALSGLEDLAGADAYVLAVPHQAYLEDGRGWGLINQLAPQGGCLVADIPAVLPRQETPETITLWRL